MRRGRARTEGPRTPAPRQMQKGHEGGSTPKGHRDRGTEMNTHTNHTRTHPEDAPSQLHRERRPLFEAVQANGFKSERFQKKYHSDENATKTFEFRVDSMAVGLNSKKYIFSA